MKLVYAVEETGAIVRFLELCRNLAEGTPALQPAQTALRGQKKSTATASDQRLDGIKRRINGV